MCQHTHMHVQFEQFRQFTKHCHVFTCHLLDAPLDLCAVKDTCCGHQVELQYLYHSRQYMYHSRPLRKLQRRKTLSAYPIKQFTFVLAHHCHALMQHHVLLQTGGANAPACHCHLGSAEVHIADHFEQCCSVSGMTHCLLEWCCCALQTPVVCLQNSLAHQTHQAGVHCFSRQQIMSERGRSVTHCWDMIRRHVLPLPACGCQ